MLALLVQMCQLTVTMWIQRVEGTGSLEMRLRCTTHTAAKPHIFGGLGASWVAGTGLAVSGECNQV